MGDAVIYETGNGGDLRLVGDDIQLTEGIFNQIYLAMFGGNVAAVTTGDEPEGQQREDYFGNFFLDPSDQFNSRTEKALQENALSVTGRLNIQEAVEKDLEFLREVASISVSSRITEVDKIEITIRAQEPNTQENKALQVIWDATRSEVIESIII